MHAAPIWGCKSRINLWGLIKYCSLRIASHIRWGSIRCKLHRGLSRMLGSQLARLRPRLPNSQSFIIVVYLWHHYGNILTRRSVINTLIFQDWNRLMQLFLICLILITNHSHSFLIILKSHLFILNLFCLWKSRLWLRLLNYVHDHLWTGYLNHGLIILQDILLPPITMRNLFLWMRRIFWQVKGYILLSMNSLFFWDCFEV